MARKYGVSIDLNQNELQNARVQNLASDPASGVEGQVYYNTTSKKLRVYANSAWGDVTTAAGGDVSSNTSNSVDNEIALFSGTGGKTIKRATTSGILKGTSGVISAATAGTDYTTPSSTESFTNKSFDANGTGNSITNLETADFASGVIDNDATLAANSSTKIATQQAVKGYVDNAVAGLDWKEAVRVATTTSGTLATSFANGQTVDGVTLVTGDRILIKDQSTQTQNGIYIVAASGAPSRASDADTGAELLSAAVYVREGTSNAGSNWVNNNSTTPTIGTDNVTFVQFKGQVEAAASTSSAGVVQLATSTEAEAKSSTTKALTPSSVANFPVKKTFTIGDTSATSFTCTHNLGTTDVVVGVYKVSTGDEWLVDITRTSTSVVTVAFATAPSTNEYKVVVIG